MRKIKVSRIIYVCSFVLMFIVLTIGFINNNFEESYCNPCLSKLQSKMDEREQITFEDLNNVAKFCESDNEIEEIYCINDYVKRNFKNVVENRLSPQATLKTINEGGDCDSWAKVYQDFFTMMGYTSEIETFNYSKTEGHGYLRVQWKRNNLIGYCIIDQRDIIGCNFLGG